MVDIKIFILFFSSLILPGCNWLDEDRNYCLNNMKFCFDIKPEWINNELMNSKGSSGLVNKINNNYMDVIFPGELNFTGPIIIEDLSECKSYDWGTVCSVDGILGFDKEKFLQHFKNYKIIKGRDVLIYCDDYSCLNEIKRLR